MARPISLAVLALGAAGPAIGAFGAPADAQEWTVESRLTAAAAIIDEATPLAPAADHPLLVDGAVVVTREDVLDGGLVLTWRGEARVQRDAANRPTFAGVFASCDASLAPCPRTSSGTAFASPVSPVTGLAAGGIPEDSDWTAAIEGASLSVAGGWGEGVFGLDSGVASRLDARPPRVLEEVSAASSSLDPTGLAVTRARNDVTGPSPKISYMTPRLLGLRLGASWTPEANLKSVDFDPRFDGPGLASAELENVWEGALSFARQFPQAGVRIRAAVTATRADSGSRFTEFGHYEAYGAGLEVEKGPWTFGTRWLGSDNAWRPGGAGYEAWEVGLVRQGETWRFGVEGGRSKDKLTGIEGSSWLVGVSRKINSSLRAGIGWMNGQADLPIPAGLGLGHINARNDGFVFELTVRN
jgi:hypothetical protein